MKTGATVDSQCQVASCEPIVEETCWFCGNGRHGDCSGIEQFGWCSCKCFSNDNLKFNRCIRCNDKFKAYCEHEKYCHICYIIESVNHPENFRGITA